MTKENRFEGLMGVVGKKQKAQTSGPRNDSDFKSESQAEVHSARSDAQKSGRKKKTSSESNVETSKRSNIQTSKVQADNSNSNISASKHTDVQMFKKAKSANPDYTRTTVYLPKKMHKLLKAIALDEEREMSSIVEELIETWLSKRK